MAAADSFEQRLFANLRLFVTYSVAPAVVALHAFFLWQNSHEVDVFLFSSEATRLSLSFLLCTAVVYAVRSQRDGLFVVLRCILSQMPCSHLLSCLRLSRAMVCAVVPLSNVLLLKTAGSDLKSSFIDGPAQFCECRDLVNTSCCRCSILLSGH